MYWQVVVSSVIGKTSVLGWVEV